MDAVDGAAPAAGQLTVIPNLESPQLRNRRDIHVYLPPCYGAGDRDYPVVYMHDGQNLFDPSTCFSEPWLVAERMASLSALGREAIVVGIPNMGGERCDEYSPFVDPRHGGGHGDAYLDFLIETVKSTVESRFRVRAGAEATGIFGSSMGALISLYGLFHHPEVFGFAGVMSPSLWFANGRIFDYIRAAQRPVGKLYLDVGTAEGDRGVADVRRLHALLLEKGFKGGASLLYVEDEGARHSESAWSARLRTALYFLLP